MTKVEILTNRQFLSIADLMQVFDCGRSSAERVMREIKAVSDIAKLKGKVTVTDYDRWFNGKKEVEI